MMTSNNDWTEPVIYGIENVSPGGSNRREFLGKAAVGVGVAGATWAVPSIVSSRAYAQGSCAPCSTSTYTGLDTRHFSPSGVGMAWGGATVTVCIPAGATSVTVTPTDPALNLVFDEAVTFSVTRVGGGTTLAASYSSYELTCGTPAPTQIAVGALSIDITSLFDSLACGDYDVVMSHCNDFGQASVSPFTIVVA